VTPDTINDHVAVIQAIEEGQVGLILNNFMSGYEELNIESGKILNTWT